MSLCEILEYFILSQFDYDILTLASLSKSFVFYAFNVTELNPI